MLFAFAQPIRADLLTELLIGLAALIFLVLRQLFEANKQAGPQRNQPPGAPQQQPTGKNAAQQAGQQADPLRNQVEEFLRRAGRPPQGGQPQPPQRPAQQAPASEIEVLVDDGSRPRERRPLAEPMRTMDADKSTARPTAAPQPVVKAEKKPPARRSVVPKRRVTLAERAAAREEIRLGGLAEQPPHLGKRIIEEDEQFDIQLKAKFDHAVGTLADSTAPAAAGQASPASDTPAARIASMLSNPDGVRQAVIVNEILRRPSDRW